MKKFLCLASLTFAVAVSQASTLLNVANVSAPAINCVFSPSCSVVVQDTTAPIPFAGWPDSAGFFLQSRTYAGLPGSPAAGLYAYEYRIDLTNPLGVTGPDECLFAVTIDFGPNVAMDFDGSGTLNDVFVTTDGGIGSIGPTIVERDGTKVTFVFAAEADTGLISQMCPGGSSFFMGLVSTQPPIASTALIDQPPNHGSAQKGIPAESVAARTPRDNPFNIIGQIIRLAQLFPLQSYTGPDNRVREIHRRLTLDLLEDARDLIDLSESDAAAGILRVLLDKVTGQTGNWLQDIPTAGINDEFLLFENLSDAIDLLQPPSPGSTTTPTTN